MERSDTALLIRTERLMRKLVEESCLDIATA